MSIDKILKKERIRVIAQVNDDVKVQLFENIVNKICDTFPSFNLDKAQLFDKLQELNLYYAELEKNLNDANYLYKNKSIYININVTSDKLEDSVLHEVIHFLQERYDKFGFLKQMRLCRYSHLSVSGLALNEAATQHLASFLLNKEVEEVRYFGINFKTNSPKYYPIECALIAQLDYLLENHILFKSTLLSDNSFFEELEDYFPKDAIETIVIALDEMLEDEERIALINSKIVNITDRNKSVDKLINKINSIKSHLLIKFMRTQNLIISSYFDQLFTKIVNFEQIDYYRKKLYNFREYIGTTEGYSFFEEYYLDKMVLLNKRATELENGYEQTSLSVVSDNIFTKIYKTLILVFRLNQLQNRQNSNDNNTNDNK